MEPNKRGLLQLTNKVPLVGLHNQSVSGTSLGTPKRTWQKESLDSPSLIWQVGKLRPGHVHDWSKTSKSEPAHLKTDRSIQKKNKQKTDDLSKFKVSRRYYGSRQIFFFSVSLIRMVDSNQFPSFQLPQTLHMDNLKPQWTQMPSLSVLKGTTPSRARTWEEDVYFLSY